MSDFQTEVRNALVDLRKSPTFAMSLGAKELFHSNFLAFLLESREPVLGPLQIELRKLFGCPKGKREESWCFVYRELRNLDLVIVPVCCAQAGGEGDAEAFQPSGSPSVVIEAKLKALPTAVQLEMYSRLLADGAKYPWEDFNGETHRDAIFTQRSQAEDRLVLLTLDGEAPPAMSQDLWAWRAVGWIKVALCVKSFAKQAGRGQVDAAIVQIVEDYGSSLENLIHVADQTRGFYQKSKQRKYSEFVEAIVGFKELRAARLMDLVGKRAYSEWLADILGMFRGKLPVGEAFLTKAKPGLTVEWQLKSAAKNSKDGKDKDGTTLRVGVQIQGYSFRRFVAVEPAWDGLEKFIADGGLIDTWFSGSISGLPRERQLMGTLPGKRTAERPRAGRFGARRTNLRVFNAEKFLYSAVDLAATDATLERINTAIKDSMMLASRLVAKLVF